MPTEIRGGQIKDDTITGDDVDESTLDIAEIEDADNDTKIEVEQSPDEDKIRFSTAGTERMVIDTDGGIAFGNTSVSGASGAWNYFNFKGGGLRVTAHNFYCDNDRGVLWGDSSVSIKGNATAGTESLTVRANYNAYIHVDGVNDSVGIGTITPTASLHIDGTTYTDGGVKWKIEDVNAHAALTVDQHVIRCVQSSSITLTLPSKSSSANHVFIIKDALGTAATNTIRLAPNGVDTIDGSASPFVMDTNYASTTIICDGINGWMILG